MAGPADPERGPRDALFVALRLYGIVIGAVLAFGAELVLFVLVGHWLDGFWGIQPWLTVTGAVLGCALGLYQLVLAVRQLGRTL